jgi:hypothetical protein
MKKLLKLIFILFTSVIFTYCINASSLYLTFDDLEFNTKDPYYESLTDKCLINYVGEESYNNWIKYSKTLNPPPTSNTVYDFMKYFKISSETFLDLTSNYKNVYPDPGYIAKRYEEFLTSGKDYFFRDNPGYTPDKIEIPYSEDCKYFDKPETVIDITDELLSFINNKPADKGVLVPSSYPCRINGSLYIFTMPENSAKAYDIKKNIFVSGKITGGIIL